MSAFTSKAVRRVRYLASVGRLVATDREARQARLTRSHLRSLRKLNPSLRVLGVEDDGGTTFVHASDDVLTPVLLARGHFQRDDLLRALDLSARLAPRPGASTFLDVGANVGTTTLYAARSGRFGRIVAVEPSPDNLAVLRLNVQANGLEEMVHVAGAACGAEAGTVDLMLSSVSAADHRVRRSSELPATHQRVVQVPERPLDEIVASAGVDPADIGLVWVDTQGHEPSVLAGATETIRGGAPFVVEFWPEMYREAGTLDRLLERMAASFGGWVELRDEQEVIRPVAELDRLVGRLLEGWHGQTDLLLLPGPTRSS